MESWRRIPYSNARMPSFSVFLPTMNAVRSSSLGICSSGFGAGGSAWAVVVSTVVVVVPPSVVVVEVVVVSVGAWARAGDEPASAVATRR